MRALCERPHGTRRGAPAHRVRRFSKHSSPCVIVDARHIARAIARVIGRRVADRATVPRLPSQSTSPKVAQGHPRPFALQYLTGVTNNDAEVTKERHKMTNVSPLIPIQSQSLKPRSKPGLNSASVCAPNPQPEYRAKPSSAYDIL